MNLTGELLIGRQSVRGTHGEIRAIDPASGETLAPAFGGATRAQLDQACALAAQAFDGYRETPLAQRAALL